jgi:hypothetical protein
MLQSFIQAGKLKRWLARPDCPDVIKECKAHFDKAYAHKSDGFAKQLNGEDLLVDDLSTDNQTSSSQPQTTPDDLRVLIRQDRVILSAWHKHNGIIYSRSTTHLGNSLVYFYLQGDRSTLPIPASIKYIFTNGVTTSYAVQRQLPLEPNIIDPFARYPHFPAKLYSSTISPDLEIIEVDWIASHFARWQLSESLAVILSLSQVRVYLIYFCILLIF